MCSLEPEHEKHHQQHVCHDLHRKKNARTRTRNYVINHNKYDFVHYTITFQFRIHCANNRHSFRFHWKNSRRVARLGKIGLRLRPSGRFALSVGLAKFDRDEIRLIVRRSVARVPHKSNMKFVIKSSRKCNEIWSTLCVCAQHSYTLAFFGTNCGWNIIVLNFMRFPIFWAKKSLNCGIHSVFTGLSRVWVHIMCELFISHFNDIFSVRKTAFLSALSIIESFY